MENLFELFKKCIKDGIIKIKYIPEVIGNLYPDMRSSYLKEYAKVEISIMGKVISIDIKR